MILNSRVYDVASETPLDFAKNLSRRLDNSIWLKREDLQSVFSFKLRGAYNKIANLDAASCANGIIAASAGNHAQGVALAAHHRGIKALIVMPRTTPGIKVEAVRAAAANPAALLGLDDRGRLAAGLRADLVELDAGSLAVRRVMRAGEWIVRA